MQEVVERDAVVVERDAVVEKDDTLRDHTAPCWRAPRARSGLPISQPRALGVRAAPPRTMAEDSVLSRFVEWFEREDIGATFDAFIADHASSFLGASAATEQRLEWTHLYNEYVALFDEKLQSFLEGAGTTQEAFLSEASTAEGLHDAYLQIFLAHAEYDTFIDLMAEQAEKQQS